MDREANGSKEISSRTNEGNHAQGMLRTAKTGKLVFYVAKKDLEDEVVSVQFDEADKWGGELELRDGSRYFVEPFAARPKLPVDRPGPEARIGLTRQPRDNIDGPRTFARVGLTDRHGGACLAGRLGRPTPQRPRGATRLAAP